MFDRTLLPSRVYYGQLFTLKGSKTQVLVPCCFHHDKSPSLSINLTKGTFNCLGCGAKGGDVLDFHKLKNGLDTIEAAKELGAWIDMLKTRFISTLTMPHNPLTQLLLI